MDAGLGGSVLALTTFGGNAGQNTAESVVVDDAGDAYVSGHMASGSFELDGTINLFGKWKVTKVQAQSGGIGNLLQASNLLSGANASSTNVGFYDVINFGQNVTDGRIGGSAGFPGGWSENFALRASGSIWVNSAGTITFDDYTDDGSLLQIDGAD